MDHQSAAPTRVFNEKHATREDRVEEVGSGFVILPAPVPRLSDLTDHSSSEGIQMNAAMSLTTAADLAHRVAMVRESVPLADLEDLVEELGECRRSDTERWYLGASGTRTVARDLVQTESERDVCGGCPVRDRCLTLAVLTGDTGDSIHGGLLPVQQRLVAAALPEQQTATLVQLPAHTYSARPLLDAA